MVALHTLPVIASDRPAAGISGSTSRASASPPVSDAVSAQATDIFAALERLAELKQKGILSEEEFTTKKRSYYAEYECQGTAMPQPVAAVRLRAVCSWGMAKNSGKIPLDSVHGGELCQP